MIQGKHVGSCLGDLFSVSFIEDIDSGNINQSLGEQFKIVQKLTSLSKVMQWGDLTFQGDKVADYISGTRKLSSNLRTIKPIRRVGQSLSNVAKMNSRTMKLQSLSAIYAREHSPEVFEEMMQEMASMQRYDSAFKNFDSILHLNGKYDSANINFECFREVMNAYEAQCGKFSDYGLQFGKNFVEACEKHETSKVVASLKC